MGRRTMLHYATNYGSSVLRKKPRQSSTGLSLNIQLKALMKSTRPIQGRGSDVQKTPKTCSRNMVFYGDAMNDERLYLAAIFISTIRMITKGQWAQTLKFRTSPLTPTRLVDILTEYLLYRSWAHWKYVQMEVDEDREYIEESDEDDVGNVPSATGRTNRIEESDESNIDHDESPVDGHAIIEHDSDDEYILDTLLRRRTMDDQEPQRGSTQSSTLDSAFDNTPDIANMVSPTTEQAALRRAMHHHLNLVLEACNPYGIEEPTQYLHKCMSQLVSMDLGLEEEHPAILVTLADWWKLHDALYRFRRNIDYWGFEEHWNYFCWQRLSSDWHKAKAQGARRALKERMHEWIESIDPTEFCD